MLKNFVLTLLTISIFISPSVFAKEINAKASLSYKSYNSEMRDKAIKKARESAWKKYSSGFSVARKSTYRQNKQEFLNSLPDFIIEEVVVQEKNDKEKKVIKIALRVNIDDNAVTALSSILTITL